MEDLPGRVPKTSEAMKAESPAPASEHSTSGGPLAGEGAQGQAEGTPGSSGLPRILPCPGQVGPLGRSV